VASIATVAPEREIVAMHPIVKAKGSCSARTLLLFVDGLVVDFANHKTKYFRIRNR